MEWCESHYLILKTNEMIFDHRVTESHSCVVIGDCTIEQVESYLGVVHVDLWSKLSQRLHFRHKSDCLELTFYDAVFGILVRYNLLVGLVPVLFRTNDD